MSTQPEGGAPAKPSAPPDKVMVITVPPYGRAYEGALARLARDRTIQVEESDTQMDAVTLARKTDFAVMLCHSSTPEELVKQVTLLKLLAPQIKQKRLRVIATTSVKHESAATSLNFYGATEMLTEPFNEKALQFKIERQVRAAAQLRARVSKAKADMAAEKSGKAGDEAHDSGAPGASAQHAKENRRSIEPQTDPDAGAKHSQPQLIRKPALTIGSDFWFTAEIEVKRIRDRWLVRLVGPSPDLGRWLKAPGEAHSRQGTQLWIWVPNDPHGKALFKEEGDWFFRGQRPEFQELEWVFIAVQPELFFKAGDKVLGTKMKTDEHSNLLVARDSEGAAALVPLVNDSLVNMGKRTFRKTEAEEDPDDQDPRAGEKKRKKRAQRSAESDEEELDVKMVEPLKLASDCWLLLDRQPRRITKRWVIRMMGPTPANGRWVSVGSSNLLWSWAPLDPEKDPFIKDEGDWLFRGLPPKFQDDTWLFVADKPSLTFTHASKSQGAKVACDPKGNLLLARDSEQAKARLPLIEESLRKIFKNEAEADSEEKEADSEKDGTSAETQELEGVLAAEREEDEDLAAPSDATPDEDQAEEEEIEIERKRKRRARVEADEDEPDSDEDDKQEEDPGDEPESEGKKRRRKNEETDDDLYAVQEGRKSKELSIEIEADDPGEELEAVQEGAGPGKELSATQEGPDEGEELSATADGPGEGEELSATTEGPGEGEELEATEEGKRKGKELSAKMEDAEETAGSEIAQEATDEAKDGEIKQTAPVKPEDAKGIRAPGPPGPTLSPLALAFLMSELVNDRTKSMNQGATRYCAYLSASCGGLQTELWCKGSKGWVCAATSDGAGKVHETEARALDQDPTTKLHGTDTLVSAVRYAGEICGALVIHGNGTDGVKTDYAEAAARVASGIVVSLGRMAA